MTKRKTPELLPMLTQDEAYMPVPAKPRGRPDSYDQKRLRKVMPIGMRVLVRIRREADVTDGGLYLPEGAKAAAAESMMAEVVEVASAVDEHSDEETNISGIPHGATVLIPRFAGTKVPWDDSLRLVETKEILAIVSEISVS